MNIIEVFRAVFPRNNLASLGILADLRSFKISSEPLVQIVPHRNLPLLASLFLEPHRTGRGQLTPKRTIQNCLRELVKNQTAWPVLNSQLAVVAAGVSWPGQFSPLLWGGVQDTLRSDQSAVSKTSTAT